MPRPPLTTGHVFLAALGLLAAAKIGEVVYYGRLEKRQKEQEKEVRVLE